MSVDENKRILRRYVDEIVNGRNPGAAHEVIALDIVIHATTPARTPGPDGYTELFARLRGTFPDYVIEAEEMIGEGDKVAVQLKFTGTHLGPWGTMPPTGKRITMSEILIARIEKRKMAETWSHGDHLGLMQQLGDLPSSSPLQGEQAAR